MNLKINGFGSLPSVEVTDITLSYRDKKQETVISIPAITSLEVTAGTFSQFGHLTVVENGRTHKIDFASTFNKDMAKLQSELGFQNENEPMSVKQNKEAKPQKTIAEMEAEMPDSWKEKQAEKARVEQLKKDKIPYCPKCHSTSITYQNKRLSVGRAVVGGAIAGGVGAVLGGTTSKKGKLKCLNCGHEWKI